MFEHHLDQFQHIDQ